MTARKATNAAILERTLRRLRRDGRLDDVSELLGVAAAYSARLVDTHCAPDSEAPAYAQARTVAGYIAALRELSGRITPSRGPDDPWERIARELETTSRAAEDLWAAE